MDSEASISDPELEKCCDCGCSYCSAGAGNSQYWNRAVKRKVDGLEDEKGFVSPGLGYPVPPVARVQIENECDALREIVNNQQQSIQDLYVELEEERNSSSTAANEAMSMILRLQRDKSEIQMEARQFKRYAEEKIAHDQQEISALEDLLYKREQVIQSLTCEAQAYKHRMMSFGLTESEAEGEIGDDTISQEGQLEFPRFEYPPLRCISNEVNSISEVENDINDFEKYYFDGTPRSVQHLKNLELRISRMERNPRFNEIDSESPAAKSVIEKVIIGQSHMMHSRKFSVDSSNSFLGYGKDSLSNYTSESPRLGSSFKKTDYVVHSNDHSNARKMDTLSEVGDFMKDKVYTVDHVYNGAPCTTPRDSINHNEMEDPEIKKLYMRLQALEAERESMRQTLHSMSTDKAQLLLLKEIAQQLCKDMAPARRMPIRKPSIFSIFPFVTVFKWVASIVFWKKGINQSKYTFGLTANNMGLLMLLDRGPHAKPWRCLTRPLVFF
uniref:GTD-binding domain-containing protein n=2 Tax=Kalanchoe fedtschenkoi TaxID=63787 RepID=A0A7N0V206_KALFE